jgi:hypothetical protein
MKKLSLYFFMFLAIAVSSNGQNRFVLEGTVGKYPIVMKIESRPDGNLTALYFYKNHRHDIELNGKQQFVELGALALISEKYDSKSTKSMIVESFSIKLTGNKSLNEWIGEWHDQKGNTLPVKLKPLDTLPYHFEQVPDFGFENEEERIYKKARLSGIKFIKDSITRYQSYELQWIHETASRIKSFVLVNGFSPPLLEKINKVMHKSFFSNIDGYYSCTGTGGGDFETAINGYFISPEYISVHAKLFTICGGVHPNSGDNSFTIDAKTGNEISSLDQIFWFTGKKPLQEKDPAYYDYIDERTKAIMGILTKLYPSQMKKKAAEDDCDYSHPYPWQFPTWYFTAKGLFIGAVFPHANEACDSPDFAIIPYAVLKQYLPKK